VPTHQIKLSHGHLSSRQVYSLAAFPIIHLSKNFMNERGLVGPASSTLSIRRRLGERGVVLNQSYDPCGVHLGLSDKRCPQLLAHFVQFFNQGRRPDGLCDFLAGKDVPAHRHEVFAPELGPKLAETSARGSGGKAGVEAQRSLTIHGRRFADILHPQLERTREPDRLGPQGAVDRKFDRDPRSLIGEENLPIQIIGADASVGSGHGGVSAASGFFEGRYDGVGSKPRYDRRNDADQGLSQCERLLPFRGLSGFPLGAQVGVITSLGAAFLWGAAFGAARLLGVFDGGRPTRLRSWLLIVVCAPVGAALYSLAALGGWRAVFGLCGL
jgi:hypothetical protein